MLLIHKQIFKLFMDVFAEETNTNFEDAIRRARQEEKDKLYPEIEAQKEKVKSALADVAARDTKITALEAKILTLEADVQKLTKELGDSKGVTSKAKDEQVLKLEKDLEAVQKQLTEAQTASNTEMQKLKLEIFKKEQLLAAGDAIVPGLVTGNTEDEIKASIEVAKQEYLRIQEKTLNGITLTPANPNTGGSLFKDKTAEEISKMSTKEYAEWRASRKK